ncbi:MAG: hypothetical protein AAF478_13255 [Pseudomonadota bacterium]
MSAGAKTLKDARDIIQVSCDLCGAEGSWKKQELLDMRVGKDAALPDLINGLARLLKCERQLAGEHSLKSKPCMLRYVDSWD